MTHSDVIVIGGGMAGISAAAELAQHMSVRVLEAEPQIGYHASGRSAAIFIRNYGNATLRLLNAASAPFLQAPETISETSLLSPRGELMIASESELDVLEAYAQGASGLERLTPQEAVELFPILRPEGIAAAMVEWDAQDIDVDRMLAGYLRQLRHAGGQVETNARVAALIRQAGIWQVQTEAATYSAPILINAAGAWAGQVGQMANALPIPLQPLRRSMAQLSAPDGYDPSRWPLCANAFETWYAKPQAGKLLVSPADADPMDPHDAWADEMVLAEGLHRFEQAMRIEVTRVEHNWAGLRTFAPDGTPVVGFDPQVEGFFWLAGQGGYGIQTAPALSKLTAALMTGQASPVPTVLKPLSPDRFTSISE